jgi:ribonucleoside-diphosphate reductase alpha chain
MTIAKITEKMTVELSTKQYGPKTEAANALDIEKYRSPGESFKDATCRVASALKDSEEHYHKVKEITLDQRFLFGGRIRSAMGSAKAVTPYNCFVAPTIEDSFTEGKNSIMDTATVAATTMRMGGGIGYDFSTLRPSGATIHKLGSKSSGPVSFMGIFNSICKTVSSSGHRRGAQMGVMRVDHPDIFEFINAKHDGDTLTQFNMSVGVTDEFMEALKVDGDFDLRYNGKVYNTVKATDLWETLMRSTWDWGEPGVIFIDRMNEYNNLWYCESIATTNPCAEQPLPPNGACLLGSFNMTKYIAPKINNPDQMGFNYPQFAKDIPYVVRALDNVVDRAIYPLYEQEKEAKNKRRMGIGVTGMANALEAIGFPYGTEEYIMLQDNILSVLTNQCYKASAELAKEKGSFPLFDKRKYLKSKFIQSLDEETIALIKKNGIRNSHLISIAPTGTISQTADNVSTGVEPVFTHKQRRLIQEFDGVREVDLNDYGYEFFGVEGKTVKDVTTDEHIKVLCNAQRWTDSGVSKTCNVPPTTSWSDFKDIYLKAYEGGAKGCTTFTMEGKRQGILSEAKEEETGNERD